MEEFDRLVTVPGLTLARVREHVEHLDADRYLEREYRAIKTSGATGTEALHVYGWDAFVTFVMQGSRWTGRRGEAPDAVLAQVFSCSPKHESGIFHAFSTFESGGPPSHCFSGTMSLPDLVTGLNACEPKVEALQGWPSVIRLLALEAVAGRLTVTPTWVSVAGEVCTSPVREAVRAAWGLELSEFWGCSEGTYAFPCGLGHGMHIADDLVILEPVDAAGNVVPYGQSADRVLLTNLYNLDQPLIRYDIADAMTITDVPCPCGCAHRRITDIRGRMDGIFEFQGGVAVPRRGFEMILLAAPGVADFLVGQTDRGVDVSIVTNGSCDGERLSGELVDLLVKHGLIAPEVQVREVETPDRLWSGKVRQFAPSSERTPGGTPRTRRASPPRRGSGPGPRSVVRIFAGTICATPRWHWRSPRAPIRRRFRSGWGTARSWSLWTVTATCSRRSALLSRTGSTPPSELHLTSTRRRPLPPFGTLPDRGARRSLGTCCPNAWVPSSRAVWCRSADLTADDCAPRGLGELRGSRRSSCADLVVLSPVFAVGAVWSHIEHERQRRAVQARLLAEHEAREAQQRMKAALRQHKADQRLEQRVKRAQRRIDRRALPVGFRLSNGAQTVAHAGAQ